MAQLRAAPGVWMKWAAFSSSNSQMMCCETNNAVHGTIWGFNVRWRVIDTPPHCDLPTAHANRRIVDSGGSLESGTDRAA